MSSAASMRRQTRAAHEPHWIMQLRYRLGWSRCGYCCKVIRTNSKHIASHKKDFDAKARVIIAEVTE